MSETSIVSYTNEELDAMERRGESQTDWDYLRNLTDEEIAASVDLEDEDEALPDLTHPGFEGLPPGIGLPKKQITVRLDQDVIDWFKSQGKGYQTRMNAVLRQYMVHHRS